MKKKKSFIAILVLAICLLACACVAFGFAGTFESGNSVSSSTYLTKTTIENELEDLSRQSIKIFYLLRQGLSWLMVLMGVGFLSGSIFCSVRTAEIIRSNKVVEKQDKEIDQN